MTISSDRILYEDEHLLAVSKRSGELSVKGKGRVRGKESLFDFLKKDYEGLRAIHRLDFETSGVMVFAKDKQTEEKVLSNKFEQWEKTYLTLVMGRIDRNRGAIRKKLPSRAGARAGARASMIPAETLYTVLDRFANSTYVECVITTGRHHQIRRHFAGIKHPLVLDKEYGHPKFNQLFRQELGYSKFFLHAAKLSFPHPITGEKVIIEAPMPRAFDECVRRLRELSK